MTSAEIRQRFLNFFAARGHAILPSASLVPENDPSVLFNTAGMQPLVPYLMGQPHPSGKRLANAQKCVRTQDIEEVGDNTHDTFFEMLGNWSLGDYFKEESIKWSFELLTSKEEGFGLDPDRLYVTVFEGNDDAPRDEESFEIWKKYLPENRIYYLGWNGKKEPNWWDAGDNGPCGPDTEIFYDVTGTLGDMTKEEYLQADEEQKVVEIWNNVFMEYIKENGKVIGKLTNKNVDTGSGLERVVMAIQGKTNIFETDLFVSIMDEIKRISREQYNERPARIITDHLRTSVLLINDGVFPGNKDQGYILRRLLRRAILKMNSLYTMPLHSDPRSGSVFVELISKIYKIYKSTPYLIKTEQEVFDVIFSEEMKFRKTLEQGLKEFEKGTDPFILATTYGFPIELTEELATEKGILIDRAAFDSQMKEHQNQSRAGAEQKFKGGLANTNEATVKLHTAHHLLLAALQEVLGREVKQRGSNITEERLRIDFNFDRKVTPEELATIEEKVNQWIQAGYDVVRREMPRVEAEALGAEMEFGAKYPDIVSVYTIQDPDDKYVSKEFCGGPHVTNTHEIGGLKIQKEEASSAGIRRIKAILL